MKRAWWYYIPHLAAGAVALLLLYRLRTVLAPFVIAYLLAALLDPLVDRMEKRGMRRGAAVLCIFTLFLALFVFLIFAGLPVAVREIKQFSDHVPGYLANARHLLETNQPRFDKLGIPTQLQDTLAQHTGEVYTAVTQHIGQWAQALLGSIGFLLWLVIIPIATFYLLNDMDRVRARFLQLVPARQRGTAQAIAADVAGVFLSYLRGLCTISVLYGGTLMLVLTILRISYAVALGLLAGVLYPVPYLGPLTTTFTIFLVGAVSRGWMGGVIAGAAALAANQVFDNLLMPRIVGKSVGLHPVLSMIALLTGAELFGLAGMIVAVPVAGAIQVMALRLLPWLSAETAPEPTQQKH